MYHDERFNTWPHLVGAVLASIGAVCLLVQALWEGEPLAASLGPAGFGQLLAGGICYTVGIVFFVFDERFRHWHGIWHLCVIGGSTLHYVAVLVYVV